MKQVCQLDKDGYFVGVTIADESPLEQGVYLIPAGAVDAEVPNIPDGYKALWQNGWVYESIPVEPEPEPEPADIPDPQITINEEARAYLNSTDWYVVRFVETGVAIPQEILDTRQAARERIV